MDSERTEAADGDEAKPARGAKAKPAKAADAAGKKYRFERHTRWKEFYAAPGQVVTEGELADLAEKGRLDPAVVDYLRTGGLLVEVPH